MLSKIDIGLDSKTNEHLLILKFQFPIVSDDYKDSMVEEGESIRVIKGSFSSPYHQGKNSTAKKVVKKI